MIVHHLQFQCLPIELFVKQAIDFIQDQDVSVFKEHRAARIQLRSVHFGFDGFFPDAALVDQFHGEVMESVIVHLSTDSEFVKEFSMLLEVSVSQVFGLAYAVGVILGQCKHCKSHSYSQRFSLAWFQFNNIAFKIIIFLVLSCSDAQHSENTNDLRNMRNGHCALYI